MLRTTNWNPNLRKSNWNSNSNSLEKREGHSKRRAAVPVNAPVAPPHGLPPHPMAGVVECKAGWPMAVDKLMMVKWVAAVGLSM